MYDPEEQTKRIFGSDQTMGLFVALYLILLAFFILLNGVSDHAAKRAEAAMESVNSAFKDSEIKQKSQINIDPAAQEAAANDVVLNQISRAFFAEMGLTGRFSSGGGSVFEVQFPADNLFQRGSFRVKASMTSFLNQLVSAVQKPINGRPQQIAIMFGTGTRVVDREMTRTQEIAVRRAGSIARYLRRRGVPDGVFTIGFVAIPEGEILAAFLSAAPGDRRRGRP